MKKTDFFTKMFWILALLAASSLVLTSCNGDEATVYVDSVSIYPSSFSIALEDPPISLTANILPSDATNRHVAWASSNPSVALVNPQGVVVGVSVGSATITVLTACGGRSNTASVTVIPTPIPVTDVSLDRATFELALGGRHTLVATVLPSNATNQLVTWSSSQPSVATVNAQGLVTGISEGSSTITVTTACGGHTATAQVSVVAYPTTDPGVVINGVRWATRNVAFPGTFTHNPQDAGMFYQWNRNIGWSSSNPMINSNGGTTWNSSGPAGATWTRANCPCPPDWRVPNHMELESLHNSGSTWVTNWNDTGINGRLYGTAPNQIFLPAAGFRQANGNLRYVGAIGGYWSSSGIQIGWENYFATNLWFGSGNSTTQGGLRWEGFSVRCVSEN